MSIKNDFLISVIIPAYNAEVFINETLSSVKNQTYTNWECIIIDDGSTDNTGTIAKEYIGADKRFHYIFQSNKGLSAARNAGLQLATGNLIQFLDADDVLLPLKFEKQLIHFEYNVLNTVSFTDYISGSSENIYIPAAYYVSSAFVTKNYISELITRWEATLTIPPHCFLFSANFFKQEKIHFDPLLKNHEDFDCWLDILLLLPQVKYLDEKLCIYRLTTGSMSKNMKLMGEGFLHALDKHLASKKLSKNEKKLIIRKKRSVLASYRRFDLMNYKDKFFSIDKLWKYYSTRILQKTGISK